MTQEEKAKAYDEALEIAKKIHSGEGVPAPTNMSILEVVFPELTESEDEQIRKRIIHALHGDVLSVEEIGKAIAWLEKQDEQKPVKWSNRDKKIIDATLWFIEQTECTDYNFIWKSEVRDWLKSLKDRVQPLNLTVTDKELAQAKKEAYNDALDKIEYHSSPTFDDGWDSAIWYLKKSYTKI